MPSGFSIKQREMEEQKTEQTQPIIPEVRSLRDRVIETLKTCYDPEIPVDIWELGLIYEIIINDGNDVHLRMTLTSPACPVAETLPPEIEDKIRNMPDVNKAKVEITFDPPWEKEMMSDEARLELGMW